MKYLGSLMSKVAVCGVFLAVAALVDSAQAEVKQGKAVVRAIRGSADYTQGAGGFKSLSVGAVLTQGAVIRTAPDSHVDLFLDQNGPVVRVAADTVLGLDKLSYDNTGADTVIDTQLDLKSGRVMGRVKKMAAASRYQVKTPTGVCGIRGTLYDIEANGRVTVKEGEVTVTYNGQQYTVHAGETFDPTTQSVRPATPEELDAIQPGGAPPPTVQVIDENNVVYVSPLVGSSGGSDYYPPGEGGKK